MYLNWMDTCLLLLDLQIKIKYFNCTFTVILIALIFPGISRTHRLHTPMDAHNDDVSAIASQVQQFWRRQQPFRIYHGSTNSTRKFHYDHIVNTAHLTRVLHVNREKQVVVVEPNVPMDQLAKATLKHGLIPLVVMEFPGITVGGGFSGTSGESSSFRHGFFDATVNWIEIVLPDGTVRRADKENDPDLFWGAASAFGTLGVVTLLEVQLQPAKPLVELKYYPYVNMKDAMAGFKEFLQDSEIEYLDGVVYSSEHILVCAGRFTDSIPEKTDITRFTRAKDEWFYVHAAQKGFSSSSSGPVTDYVPLLDYLFRYDRGGFWVGRYAIMYFLLPFWWIVRFLMNWMMHTRTLYHVLHASGHSRFFLIQDVAVPFTAAAEFLDWLDDGQHFGCFPIWLCPFKNSPGVMESGKAKGGDDYLMNFGLWAPSTHDRRAFIAQNRRLEQKVDALGGKKWLYAHTYYTEEEFWSIYNKKRYDELRTRYNADYLPDLYQKVRVDLDVPGEQVGIVDRVKGFLWLWPVSGLYGVYKALRGGDYLLQK